MEAFSQEHEVDRLRAVVAELRRLGARDAALQVGTNTTLTPAGELVDPERGVDVHMQVDGADVELRLTHRSATVQPVSTGFGEARGF